MSNQQRNLIGSFWFQWNTNIVCGGGFALMKKKINYFRHLLCNYCSSFDAFDYYGRKNWNKKILVNHSIWESFKAESQSILMSHLSGELSAASVDDYFNRCRYLKSSMREETRFLFLQKSFFDGYWDKARSGWNKLFQSYHSFNAFVKAKAVKSSPWGKSKGSQHKTAKKFSRSNIFKQLTLPKHLLLENRFSRKRNLAWKLFHCKILFTKPYLIHHKQILLLSCTEVDNVFYFTRKVSKVLIDFFFCFRRL